MLAGADLYGQPSDLRVEHDFLPSPNSEESYMASGSYEENGSYPGRSISDESREIREAEAMAMLRPGKFPEYKH